MNKIEIVGLGALNVDNIYQVERILEDGEAVAEKSALFPGGSAANTIYGLARLKVSTGFIGALGDDAEGELLLQDFQKAGVDTEQIKVKPGAKTGSTLCLSDSLGRRSIYVLPGASSLLSIDDLDLNYLNEAGMLHISSFADDGQLPVLLELMERLAPSIKVGFSPGALYATKGIETLKPILARTHILLLNESEMGQLTGENAIDGAEICLKQGCRLVVVTLGKGTSIEFAEWSDNKVTATCYIKDAEKAYLVPANIQDIISAPDTTGAGDAFATGFLFGLLRGRELDDCGHLGDIVARFSIAKVGARRGLPTLEELTQRYRQLYNIQL